MQRDPACRKAARTSTVLHAAFAVAIAGLMAGCARFEPKRLSAVENAEAFDQRSLADTGLRAFLETNGVVSTWPRESWDLNALTLAAFYYHPDMDLARARMRATAAGRITAGQRPNPSLAFTPRVNSSSIGTGTTPWILGSVLDIPVETMGKRKYRVAQAEHLGDMARFDLARAAWLVRSRVRDSLLALQAAHETAAQVSEQAATLGRLAQLVQVQWQAGEVSPVEVSRARVAHATSQLNLEDARRQEADARGQLAAALGVPLRALEGVEFTFADLGVLPARLTSSELQRQAVLNRADVLSALAEYAAAESALQVQIARQYPDIHLRPGYELDQTKNKWQLGISFDLPILHQNQGPIAEARAKREEIAARFDSVQARAIGEIERATAVYSVAVGQVATADRMVVDLEQQVAATRRMYEAGEADRLVVTSAQAEQVNGALARLRARIQAQQSLATLENAVQVPLLLPVLPAQLETAARKSDPGTKP